MSLNADDLLLSQRAGPNLDPEVHVAIAQQAAGNTGEITTLAQGISAYSDSVKFASQLHDQDPAIQARLWAHGDDTSKNLLLSVGYRPPADPVSQAQAQRGKSGHQSFWGRVAGNLGAAVEDAAGYAADHTGLTEAAKAASWVNDHLSITDNIGEAVSNTLEDIQKPLRAVQHIYRAEEFLGEQGPRPGNALDRVFGLDVLKRELLESPSDFAKAWTATEHGERSFSPWEEQRARNQWDGGTVDLAKQLASGGDPKQTMTQIIAATPDDQKDAVWAHLNSQDVQDATRFMQASKLSPGRQLVDPNWAVKNPTLYNFTSGSYDALFDFFGDPLVRGGKMIKSAEEAKTVITDAADVYRLWDGGAEAKATQITDYIKRGPAGVADLAAEHPNWARNGVADDLLAKKIDTPDKLRDWYASRAGLMAMANGQLSGIHTSEVSLPRLTTFGEMTDWLKQSSAKTINWAASDEAPAGVQPVGTFARKLVTLLPRGSFIQVNGPDQNGTFLNAARMFLPEDAAREQLTQWVAATGEAAKKKVYEGMLDELRQAAGIPEDSPWWQDVKSSKFVYSNGVREKMADGSAEAILDTQLSDRWYLPRYSDFLAAARKSEAMGHVTDAADGFMSWWRPITLMRPAFALRAGGEELVEAVMRYGPTEMVKSMLANGAVKGYVAGPSEDRLLPYHPVQSLVNRLTAGLPDEVVNAIHAPADLVGAVIGDRARKAFRITEAALAGQDYFNAARDAAQIDAVSNAFVRGLSAMEHGYSPDDMELVKQTVVRDGRVRQAYFQPTGRFANMDQSHTLFIDNWQRALDELARSRIGSKALEVYGLDHDEQVRQLANFLGSEDMAATRSKMVRATELSDGRLAGAPNNLAATATNRQAYEDWSNIVLDHVNDLLRPEAGGEINFLVDGLKHGIVPTSDELAQLPAELKPYSVKGPELVEVPRNFLRGVIDRGFKEMVGRPMDWMVRQPLFIHNYAEATATAARFNNFGLADESLREWAAMKAVDDTIPFIHDPQLRSHFSQNIRNFVPFWFAQEQFYKRFARNVAFAPEAVREAQLMMGGMRHMGVVHKDANGDDYFMYPAMGVTQRLLADTVGKVLGEDAVLPVAIGMSGQVRFASPALDRVGAPSFSPLAGVPLKYLSNLFPELKPFSDTAAGDRGQGKSMWETIVPTSLAHLTHFFIDNPDNSPQMASAMIQTAQMLDAAGHGLPDNATPAEVSAYQDRLREWARSVLLLRTALGTVGPAAPQPDYDPQGLHARLLELLSTPGFTYQQAVTQFIREHPNATAYTVFPTSSKSGGQLPQTQQALDFMDQHAALLKDYPNAGGWLIPPDTVRDGKFNATAYQEQLTLALRERKAPEAFLNQLLFARAAGDYFDARTQKQQMLAQAKGNSVRTAQINAAWDKNKNIYMAAHPVFAQMLQDPQGRLRRAEVVDQLHHAFIDPRTPESDYTAKLRDLLDGYDAWNNAITEMGRQRTTFADTRRRTLTAQFGQAVQQFVTQNPEMESFYRTIIQPEIEAKQSGSQGA